VKFPSSLVVAVLCKAVPAEVTSTVAPGIAAPCGSRTLPFICPDVFCAGTERANKSIRHGRAINIAVALNIEAVGCFVDGEHPIDLLNIRTSESLSIFQRAFYLTNRDNTAAKTKI
jgi:hypothetical protein